MQNSVKVFGFESITVLEFFSYFSIRNPVFSELKFLTFPVFQCLALAAALYLVFRESSNRSPSKCTGDWVGAVGIPYLSYFSKCSRFIELIENLALL